MQPHADARVALLSAPAPKRAIATHDLFHSNRSCSFFEPVEELEAFGVLPL